MGEAVLPHLRNAGVLVLRPGSANDKRRNQSVESGGGGMKTLTVGIVLLMVALLLMARYINIKDGGTGNG
jgi:hypothetical protein